MQTALTNTLASFAALALAVGIWAPTLATDPAANIATLAIAAPVLA